MDGFLSGRTALVTGAGRGIGQAIAIELASHGAAVLLMARSQTELASTAAQVRDAGGTSTVITVDLSDTEAALSVFDEVTKSHEHIDVVVNNAATPAPIGASATIDTSQWLSTIALNVSSAAALTFAVIPAQLAQGWGRIVNVSAALASQPQMMPGMNAYATSKAALEAHTLNLAAELAGTGVTVNAYRPGTVDTAMPQWIRDQDPDDIGRALHERFIHMHAQGHLITPERSARALVPRLAGDATGQVWTVDD
jgi:NAD(P)-dependent dehydrogenase (short-subunit alcohol dehydrogenase family)